MNPEWGETKRMIGERWPSMEPLTPTQIEDWDYALGKLNQHWLRDALRRVSITYSSTNPKLPWIIKAFNEVESENRAIARAAREYQQPEPPRSENWYTNDQADTKRRLNEMDQLSRSNLAETFRQDMQFAKGFKAPSETNDPYEWDSFFAGLFYAWIELKGFGPFAKDAK